MGDEIESDWEEYANITIGASDYYNDIISTTGATDALYDDWLANSEYDKEIGTRLSTNDIKLTGGGEEMLRVAKDGFYVRGIKVKQDKREAKAVYEAFRRWMTHAIMSGELDN